MSHNTGELICVKQLAAGYTDADWALMESDVATLRQLSHPNIVQYLGTDRAEQFTILLEYVSGGSIAQLLAQVIVLREGVLWWGACDSLVLSSTYFCILLCHYWPRSTYCPLSLGWHVPCVCPGSPMFSTIGSVPVIQFQPLC